MIQIAFKNMETSELARNAVTERIGAIVEKFPDLAGSRVRVTLEMENSPSQAGPDLFSVNVQIMSGAYGGIGLKKSSSNLYVALADVVDHMLEKLNRFGDRSRVKERSRARERLVRAIEEAEMLEGEDGVRSCG